ncbi:Uncharacterised protein [Enterobacter cloacae]|uniref:DUF8093 domain-containing protein n=1 Tax=Enterobacter cloacae TaxID=550 RepID=A0A144V682_ENTCL|nr:Uncharacterised protein [Enterobacter cloacae]SAH89676.1 Uncharacterised protein [Enterobacter cloacae]
MFRLYRSYDLTRQLNPENFQYILTPSGSLKEACIHYDLSYEANGHSLTFGLPKKNIAYLHIKDRMNEGIAATQIPFMMK